MSTVHPEELKEVLAELRGHLEWQRDSKLVDVLVLPERAAGARSQVQVPKGAQQAAAPVSRGAAPAARPLAQKSPAAAPVAKLPAAQVPARPLARPPEEPAAKPAAAPRKPASARAPRSVLELPQPLPVSADERRTLDEIRREIGGDCRRCTLCDARQKVVFGAGNPRAELVFVGDKPGADEDLQGIPFVGEAGELLTKMINAMGYSRDDVYICNVVKCRPAEDRAPTFAEVSTCEPFLRAQIGSIHPKAIVALGSFAAQTMLRDSTSITDLRGTWREYCGIPLLPTYSPAYLVKKPGEKAVVWKDLQLVMAHLAKARKEAGE